MTELKAGTPLVPDDAPKQPTPATGASVEEKQLLRAHLSKKFASLLSVMVSNSHDSSNMDNFLACGISAIEKFKLGISITDHSEKTVLHVLMEVCMEIYGKL